MRETSTPPKFLRLLVTLLTIQFGLTKSAAQVTESDSLALVALYNATDGDNWFGKTNWLQTNVGDWQGITISQGRVTQINLVSNGLNGVLPSEIGNLSELDLIYLWRNELSGSIPSSIGNLLNLEQLAVWDNNLSGELPMELSNLISLDDLQLNQNRLSGEVPASYANLTQLSALDIRGNDFTGLPDLTALTSLTYFDVSYNRIPQSDLDLNASVITQNEGQISPINQSDSLALVALYQATGGDSWTNNQNWLVAPVRYWFGVTTAMDRVTRLDMGFSGNNLLGSIPAEIGTLTALEVLNLSNNNLSGTLPVELTDLVNLKELFLQNNSLTGSISSEFGTLTKLEKLSLQGNSLSGSIPVELGDLSSLTSLVLGMNQLSGGIPAQLGSLMNLEGLQLRQNGLSGLVPPELGDLTNLTSLDLGSNQLTGPIPTELGGLLNLTYLDLSNNQLTGPLPSELGSLSSLKTFFSGNNELDGPIPPSFGNLANLEGIVLSRNQITGPIPAELGNLASLRYVWINDNNLEGALPSEMGNLSAVFSIWIEGNQLLDGPVPDSFLQLDLSTFSFGSTGLCEPDTEEYASWKSTVGSYDGTDVICPSLESDSLALVALYNATDGPNWTNNTNWLIGPVSDWYGIRIMDDRVDSVGLQSNNLSGIFPEQVGKLSELKSLSLFSNQIVGSIPFEIGDLLELHTLQIQDNLLLEGPVPDSFLQLDLNTFSFGGTGLCEPSTGEYDSWKGTIVSYQGTGVYCPSLKADSLALVALYNTTNGPNWTNHTNWLTGPITEWFGVTVEEGRVAELQLYSNNLVGSIAPDLGNLTSLTYLSLQSNGLSGQIPAALGNLTNLRSLYLSANQLTGQIPPELGELENLSSLGLVSNELTGSIPVEIGQLNALQLLYLQSNELTGSIPVELGSLSNLEWINLSENLFSGEIPPALGSLQNLIALVLADNELTGSIPVELGGLSLLEILDLSQNHLSGEVPPALGNLNALESIHLNDNQLSGFVPSALVGVNTPNLTTVDFYRNNLTGPLPPTFANLTNLQSLNVRENRLTGLPDLTALTGLPFFDVSFNQIPLEDIDLNATVITVNEGQILPTTETDSLALVALYNATNGPNWTNHTNWLTGPVNEWFGVTVEGGRVFTLDLQSNGLNGSIPDDIGVLSGLRRLDFAVNNLSGAIPDLIGNFVNLEDLDLSENDLSGEIPAVLANLIELRDLRLSRNGLTGAIPAAIGNLNNLRTLYLHNNELSGSIPADLGSLQNLQRLTVYSNPLTGAIPSELGNLTNLVDLLMGQNQFSGSIPSELGNLTNLESLSMYHSQLSGEIPGELGNLTQLRSLSLNGNRLTGSIPSSLGNLANLVTLALDRNDLSGNVPAELDKLTKLTTLSIGENHITGRIPESFAGLVTLNTLAIQSNRIDGLPDLTNLSGLQFFDVSYNRIPQADIDLNSSVITRNYGQNYPLMPADSLVLVDFYQATNGSSWINSESWLEIGSLAAEWFGIEVADGRVTKIDLRANNLEGSLVPGLGSLDGLSLLELTNNNLSGNIPPEIGDLALLEELHLGQNQLSGPLPVELGDLASLRSLRLFENELEGIIPNELGNLSQLERLWLARNQLTGEIPTELGSLEHMFQLWLAENQLTGNIPLELGNLSNLSYLGLDFNQLSGTLPMGIGTLTSLDFLLLSENPLLIGPIPESYQSLTLDSFYFNSTGICEPDTEAFDTWKLTIADYSGTDVGCEEDQTPPTITSATEVSIEENSAGTIYEVTADEEVQFSLGAAKDEALFMLTDDALGFVTIPDFEAPEDGDADNVYLLDLTATDLAGNATTIELSITVTDLDEVSPTITSATEVSIEENSAGTIYEVTADEDVQFSLGSEKDEALFTLTDDALSFVTSPDFEVPEDGDADNVYLLDLTATDLAGNATTIELSITVTDLDEVSPTITSATEVSIEENSAGTIYEVTADEDVQFSLGAAKDEALFTLTDDALSFVTSPDFEVPQDGDANNVYLLDLTATDLAGNATTIELSITVTDLDEVVPTITSASEVSIEENSAGTIYEVTADEDVQFNLGSEKDEALFTLTDDALGFVTSPDFEVPQDGDANNVYLLDLTATDLAGNATTIELSITVTDLDEVSPTITAASELSIEENIAGTIYEATADEEVEFSLGAAKDEALFELSNDNLNFLSSPDFEAPEDADANNEYLLDLTATDLAGNATTIELSITVTDLDEEAPAITSATEVSIEENTTGTIYEATANEEVEFSLGAAKDEALFTLNDDALGFVTSPDFEMPRDADTNNVYLLDVTATDASGNATTIELSIMVTDLDEIAPTITSASDVSIVENVSGAFYQATADEEVVFSLGFEKDEALFTLTNDDLSFLAPPDFEMPKDADADNEYLLDLVAKDVAGNTTVVELSIMVRDVDERVLGINEDVQFFVFPHPVTDVFSIHTGVAQDVRQLVILDLGGREVKRFAKRQDNLYSVEELEDGVYLLSIQRSSGSAEILGKLVKQR